MFIREGIRSVEDLKLSDEDKGKIYWGNALQPETAGGTATRGCGLYYWTSIGDDDSVMVSCHLSSRCGGVTGNGGVSSTQQALET
jgi:hypothetical protein